MSPATPVLFLDYVDPASLLAERRVAAAEATLALSVERRPLEMRPPPTPLLDPEDPAWRERWTAVAAEARAEGVEMAPPPALVPWTRKAHELAVLARERGVFAAVHRALFDAFLVDGRDIGRVDVLAELGRAHGLEWTPTRAALDVDAHAAAVEEARSEAERLGIRGVPTLLAGERALEGLHDPGSILAFLAER